MADVHMHKINDSFKEIGAACERISESAARAAIAINAFAAAHHDRMNAAVSAHVLRGMGRSDIARYYE